MFTHPSNWFDQRVAHFEGRARDAGLQISRSHALQLAAGAAGEKSYESLKMSGRLETVENPFFDAELASERAARLGSAKARQNLSEEQLERALEILESVFEEAGQSNTQLAWHIAEAVAAGCENHPDAGYAGAVILTQEDCRAAGDIACSDEFEDFIFEPLPWPSIVPFAYAKPDKSLDDRMSVEPGAALNVLAFLKPDTVDDVLRHARRLVSGSGR